MTRKQRYAAKEALRVRQTMEKYSGYYGAAAATFNPVEYERLFGMARGGSTTERLKMMLEKRP